MGLEVAEWDKAPECGDSVDGGGDGWVYKEVFHCNFFGLVQRENEAR